MYERIESNEVGVFVRAGSIQCWDALEAQFRRGPIDCAADIL